MRSSTNATARRGVRVPRTRGLSSAVRQPSRPPQAPREISLPFGLAEGRGEEAGMARRGSCRARGPSPYRELEEQRSTRASSHRAAIGSHSGTCQGASLKLRLRVHNNGEKIGDFRKAWKNACKVSGLEGVIPHDLRHCAARNLSRGRCS